MIAVVDYHLGNLRSICAALEKQEINYVCTSDPALISKSSALILPGVGSFPDGMRNLRELNLIDLLNELVIDKQIPILGICLGFQLMAMEGNEFGKNKGLGWLKSKVLRFEGLAPELRIPHVGWNDCICNKDSQIFAGIPKESLFYFTHSFYMKCENLDDILAYSDHGERFVAAIQKNNIFGVQFHPEKSQLHGLTLLNNFAKRIAQKC